MGSPHVDAASKRQLAAVFVTLNPAECRREITRLIAELYKVKDERGRQA